MTTKHQELQRTHTVATRRVFLVGGAQLVFVAALGLRMRHLQVEQADEFHLLAEKNRISIRLIAPKRGEIFDRFGRVLAQNDPSYRIVLLPENAGDIDAVLERLGHLIPLSADQVQRTHEDIKRNPPFVQVTVAEHVPWNRVAAVAANAPALPGISPEVGFTRVYPRGADFAHVVGYVGPVSDHDLEKIDNPNQLLRIPRFQIGKVGVEAQKEDLLRGKAGSKQLEINAVGRVMRELERRDGETGADIQLTIDANLQAYAQARLGENSASAVVIDLPTGDLRAITSSPSFDPNKFVRGISSTDYNALLNNKFRPMASKSVQGIYPPGSTFKMITALAALEDGLITPEDVIFCPGHLEVSERRFHCWKRGGHGSINLHQSLAQSCDVYFYHLAQKVGQQRIAAMSRRFGLGVKHDIPMSAVASGLIPDRAWKRRIHSEDWHVGDTVNASIGQGFVLASPLQLAVMAARLATGLQVSPRLVKTINGINQQDTLAQSLGVSSTNLEYITRAMYSVVNDRRGTGYRSRVIHDDYRMAGKTGTSQIRNISADERLNGVRKSEDLPWELRDHALFVSYAPADSPKIAVAVIVEHGGSGSSAAAPIARDITLQALHDGPPPLSVYPAEDRSAIREQQARLREFIPESSGERSDRT
ncbi:MAG: penicillin-binding protein 2 [Aestuariivita sp.]|nr:penicillin-binding protein 2 [Aestuariivita sp.]MCY4347019.1 penicillin-binding protein 2 [Aestuariivita sp.]